MKVQLARQGRSVPEERLKGSLRDYCEVFSQRESEAGNRLQGEEGIESETLLKRLEHNRSRLHSSEGSHLTSVSSRPARVEHSTKLVVGVR